MANSDRVGAAGITGSVSHVNHSVVIDLVRLFVHTHLAQVYVKVEVMLGVALEPPATDGIHVAAVAHDANVYVAR